MSPRRSIVGISITDLREAIGEAALPPEELDDLAAGLAVRWPVALRHRREIDPQTLPMPMTAVPWYDLACRHSPPGGDGASARPSRHLAYAAGEYYLQDAGSLLALAAAEADRDRLGGQLICDLCAAPGGKASALVEAIGDSGFVLANEPIRSRLAALRFNLTRTGSNRFAISSLDPEPLADRVGAVFDLVLVDAPCSGQALLSRGRQSGSALSPKQIQHNAARQRRILEAACRLVRGGGRLIYSTCTFAEAENESQICHLLESDAWTACPIDRLEPYQTAVSGAYRLWPHRHQCAGSFAASLRRLCSSTDDKMSSDYRRAPKSGPTPYPTDRLPVDLNSWFTLQADAIRPQQIDSVIVGWPADAPPWTEELAVAGPELAHRTGQTWKPAHAAALRCRPRVSRTPTVEVDSELAKRYVAGEAIPCRQRGWRVVTWSGRPLGWIKADGVLGKNHLPAAARLAGEIAG